jgi:hypothetical protein
MTDGVTVWAPALLSGTLTLSEDWSPFAQFNGTIANTFTAAELAALDPRENLAFELSAGYIHPDGFSDLHPVLTGQLDARTAKQPSGMVDLAASSEEMLCHEARWLGVESWKTFAGVTEALEWLASYGTGRSITISSSVGYLHRPDLVNSVPLTTGQTLWDAMEPIALAAGVRLYVDTDGTWTIGPRASVASITSAYLADGNGGIIQEAEDTLTRDGYAQAAVLHFEWRDAGGIDRNVIGTYGGSGKPTHSETRKSPVTQAQANAAAETVARALATRGDSYRCRGVAAWWLRPGHTVEVTLANGTTARHIVRAVTFDLIGSTMTVTTREPSNLGA